MKLGIVTAYVPPARHSAWAVMLSAAVGLALPPIPSSAAISTTGNVAPAYPGGGLDPWNAGAELSVGDSANGSLTINAGSDVTSDGGKAGNAASVQGSILVTGAGSTWSSTQDLLLGVSGHGKLDVLQGAVVTNLGASLGHVDGIGEALVEGAASEWISTSELVVGNGGDGQLTIRQQGYAVSGAARIGSNASAEGTVVVDGQGSVWEIFDSLSLGNEVDGGQATLSLTGAGSRVYVGTAAALGAAQLPDQQTALVVSEGLGLAQLYIYGGNQVQNGGSGYVGLGANRKGAVTVDGANSSWSNDGDLAIGAGGQAQLSLISGGTVSAAGTISIGEFGSVLGNGTLDGSSQNSGAIAPGLSIGNIAVAGGYSQLATGNLQIELAGTQAGQFDTLSVTGSATLDGKLQVTLDGPFSPQLGNTFNILTASGVSGQFASAELPVLPAGRMWQLRYSASGAMLAVTRAGDYNDNGVVDAADYAVWRDLLGATFNPRADGDTNGVIDAADYAVWRANFGLTAGSGSALPPAVDVAAVPEPAALVLLLAAFAIRFTTLACRRRPRPTARFQIR